MGDANGDCVRRAAVGAIGLLLACAACSSPSSPTADLPAGDTLLLDGGGVLVFLDAGRLDEWRAPIEEGVRRTLDVTSPLLPIQNVRIEVRAGRENAIPEIGFGGRADAGTVRLTFDPSPLLSDTIEPELLPLVAHELHHVARIRRVGFPGNLLEAMVLEGLADRFSVEVADIDPPRWSAALPPDEIELWLPRAREVWLRGSYDHDAWFFGTTATIPRWTGYTLGFELVGRYLEAHPGSRPSGLIAEPALSFAAAAR